MMLGSPTTQACSPERIDTPQELIEKAEGIYRVRPRSYVLPTGPDSLSVGFLPKTRLRFQVTGVLKGPARSTVDLPGTFAKSPDPNGHRVPYPFVRPAGRRGTCFATSYLKTQEYLVFLRGDTAYWSPLAPTNEEIRGASDTWVTWVAGHLKRSASSSRRK
jgi:hypothetical protein